MKRLFGTAAALLALIASPIAQAASAERVQAPMEQGASELGGGGIPLPALVVLLAIIAGGIYIAVDDDSPDSP